jgi:hypothetical protein
VRRVSTVSGVRIVSTVRIVSSVGVVRSVRRVGCVGRVRDREGNPVGRRRRGAVVVARVVGRSTRMVVVVAVVLELCCPLILDELEPDVLGEPLGGDDMAAATVVSDAESYDSR